LVYASPRSVPAFLLFLVSISLVYVMRMSWQFKLGLALVIALIIIPIIGLRNIFYLEVIFQISVFAALALGLWVGQRLRSRVRVEVFRTVVLGVLVASSLAVILSTLLR
jgi:uncharacterized membrane protein YfcA